MPEQRVSATGDAKIKGLQRQATAAGTSFVEVRVTAEMYGMQEGLKSDANFKKKIC